MSVQIITSSDGSDTLYSENLGVTYHSQHGAIQESMTVFIDAGLHFLHNQGVKNIKIFELGFGTGLNCLLSYLYTCENETFIDYTGIDIYPVPSDIINKLNYGDLLNSSSIFESLTQLPWGMRHSISPEFSLNKLEVPFEDFRTDQPFNLLYLDAFGPAIQPELWNENSTLKMYELLGTGGVLVTYCAQGQFKRNLKGAGFTLETLPGPPGKREMVRAIKN